MAVFFRYLTLSSVVRPRVGMQGQAVKVILAFGEQFWPEDMLLTFCAESVASQVWADPPRQSIHDGFHTLTGFITGSQATAASAWPTWRTVDAVLKQLDSMFSASSDRTPASRCYTDHIICDWVKFPNICSSYRSDKVHRVYTIISDLSNYGQYIQTHFPRFNSEQVTLYYKLNIINVTGGSDMYHSKFI